MGKASDRRRRRRNEYLSQLAQKNPKKFRIEWTKRLVSWSHEAEQRAAHFRNEFGESFSPVFDLVDLSMDELKACGQQAVNLEGDETWEVMTDVCCRAVADQVDSRIYRLSNSRSNCCCMKASTHKPLR